MNSNDKLVETRKISIHYATLSPNFQDGFPDWKIDKSLGY